MAQDSLQGECGLFSFNEETGEWGYSLSNSDPKVQALTTGQSVSDTLAVVSKDGTATETIEVAISGEAEFVSITTMPTALAILYNWSASGWWEYTNDAGERQRDIFDFKDDDLADLAYQLDHSTNNFMYSVSNSTGYSGSHVWSRLSDGASGASAWDYVSTAEAQTAAEFAVSGISGPVRSATLRFENLYSDKPEVFDFNLYSGDGKATTDDWNAGSGAHRIALRQRDDGSSYFEVDLDEGQVDKLLSQGESLDVNLRYNRK